MRIPKRLKPLLDEGLIDEVTTQLMSGKEADVFVVVSEGEYVCAKVYKESMKRSFKTATVYVEGRKHKNSRRARAMEKKSKFGRAEQEKAWQTAEVDAMFKLLEANVCIPRPHICHEGVLLMDLVLDYDGNVAPRLNDVLLYEDEATDYHSFLIYETVKMLCAGMVHGDLSEFNILLAHNGPVIIDFPQVVDATANNNAKKIFLRDVQNLSNYFGQYAPHLKNTHYGPEIWALFEAGDLTPDVKLTGKAPKYKGKLDMKAVLAEVEYAKEEEMERREAVRAANDVTLTW